MGCTLSCFTAAWQLLKVPHLAGPTCSKAGDFENNDEVYDAIDAASKDAAASHRFAGAGTGGAQAPALSAASLAIEAASLAVRHGSGVASPSQFLYRPPRMIVQPMGTRAA